MRTCTVNNTYGDIIKKVLSFVSNLQKTHNKRKKNPAWLIIFIGICFWSSHDFNDSQAPLSAEEGKPSPGTGEGMSVAAVLAVGVFLWAFVHQYRAAVILANLRKNKQGKAKTQKYDFKCAKIITNILSSCKKIVVIVFSMLIWQKRKFKTNFI